MKFPVFNKLRNINEIYIYILILFISEIALAQWAVQPPINYFENKESFYGSFFLNEFIGYASGENGLLIKTTDGGNSWEKFETRSNRKLNSVRFFYDGYGIAIGEKGTIGSGGFKFDEFYIYNLPTNEDLNSIFLFDPNYGWIVGNKGTVIKRTPDEDIFIDLDQDYNFNSVYFLNENVGFIAGGKNNNTGGVIFKTQNGGNDWQKIETGFFVNSIIFSDEQKGIAAGENGKILYSNNSGEIWNEAISESTDDIHSIDFANENLIFAAGKNGTILKSENAGDSWQKIQIEFSVNFNSVQAIENQIWIFGDDGVILHSNDFGNNFSVKGEKILARKKMNSLSFINEKSGWIGGKNGTIYKTTDSGDNWEFQNSKIKSEIKSIYFYDENLGWAAGDSSAILKTKDGGNNWEKYKFDWASSNFFSLPEFEKMHFLDSQNGWITGNADSGIVLKTENGGNNWQIQTFPFTKINSIIFVDKMTGWFVGSIGYGDAVPINGFIYKTENGGVDWIKQSFPSYYESHYLSDVKFINKDTGYVTGSTVNIFGEAPDEGAITLYTTNGGITWQRKDHEMPYSGFNLDDESYGEHLETIEFSPKKNWYAGGSGIIKTQTGNDSLWQNENTGITAFINDIEFVSEETGWAVADDGIILKHEINSPTPFVWKTNFSIGEKDNLGRFIILFFGQDLTAGNGIDPFLNEFDFPMNSDSIFDARYILPENGAQTLTDMRNSFDAKIEWKLSMKKFDESFPITLNWSPFELPEGKFFITDGKNFNANMKEEYQVILYENNFDTVKIIYERDVPVNILNNESEFSNMNYELYQNYPNPFNPVTKIKFQLKESGKVTLEIFNILGEKVSDLINGNYSQGNYEVEFNGKHFASGVYIYRLQINEFVKSKKMLLLK